MDDKARDQLSGGRKDTSAYAPSKAPETRREAEEKETIRDFRLIPGGRHGSNQPIGISAMNREDVPSEGRDSGLTRYGDSPESA